MGQVKVLLLAPWLREHVLKVILFSMYGPPRLFEDVAVARGDGRYSRLMNSLAKTNLLVIDDWGLSALTEPQRRDLLEITEDRHNLQSTIITSQLPVKHWHEIIGNQTLADAILDRVVHNAYKITLCGESMRKKNAITNK